MKLKFTSTLLLLFAALAFNITTSFAQGPGTLDPGFGTGGIVTTNISTADDEVLAVATQSDNRVVVAGYSGKPQVFTVARYFPNGTLDTTFGTAGVVQTAFQDRAYAYAVAIQPDGKIVVAGDGGFVFGLARYTSTGQLDTTFGTGGIVTTSIGNISTIRGLAIQGDGKILAAGYSDGDFAVSRYTTSGTLDTTFGAGDGIVTTDFYGDEDLGTSIRLQSDGKIVVGGSSLDLDLYMNFAVARYDSNGDLDTSFNGTGFATTITDCGVRSLGIDANGRIVVTGSVDDVVIARYTSGGVLDSTFGTAGLVTTDIGGTPDIANGLVIDMSGILVAGTRAASGDEDFFVAKWQNNGTLDTAFDGGDGIVITSLGSSGDTAHAIAFQPDAGIIVAGSQGSFGNKQFGIAGYLGYQPTSAPVTVSGRVTQPNGRAISGAVLTLTNMFGVVAMRTTNTFGYYTFHDVPSGETYVVSISSRRYTFDPSAIVINVMDDTPNVNFVSVP